MFPMACWTPWRIYDAQMEFFRDNGCKKDQPVPAEGRVVQITSLEVHWFEFFDQIEGLS